VDDVAVSPLEFAGELVVVASVDGLAAGVGAIVASGIDLPVVASVPGLAAGVCATVASGVDVDGVEVWA